MKKYLFLLLAGLICFKAQAQHSITGIVTDANDKTPLPGVTIMVKGTSTGTLSGTGGLFRLTIPKGKGLLALSAMKQRW